LPYDILVSPKARRDLKRLPPEMKERIGQAVRGLEGKPRKNAEKLVGEDAYRIRVGDYRIVFLVDDTRLAVLVDRVKHRREVYRR
jgi:mRNA interferase RelE/StbE